MKRLQGKTAVITGGRQGIGRAIVDMFAAEGATVLACGRSGRPADLPEAVRWVKCDVGNSAEVAQMKDHIVAEFGQLSILVNNTGVQIEKTIVETTDDEQAIVYHPNVWHLPMTVLDRDSDMLSLIYEDGSAEDCIILAQHDLYLQIDNP